MCIRDREGTLEKLKIDPHHLLVEDVVAEMEWWACFNPEPELPRPLEKGGLKQAYPDLLSGSVPFTRPDPIIPVAPITRKKEKIGRNSPCPCGSGKKYKKCCGG